MCESRYNPVTPAILDELRQIVGERFVLTDVERLESYARDESVDTGEPRLPEAVIKPRTAEEIAAVMKLANREHIPVTPRGAGSGLSGGALPIYGGIVISFERMNEILDVDCDNMMVVVEPGVVTNDINDAVAEYGLFYAGYPMSVETCAIGGNVAENAGGGKAIKYGVTERYVLGLQVVLPTGEIVRMGGKRVKDVSGYNLRMLMVGSEGTLGIITEITLKLIPRPKAVADLLVLFPDSGSAIAVVPKIMTMGGVVPTAVEFMDRTSVQAACEFLNEHLPYQDCGAMLLIEVDGNDEETVVRDYETVGELCLANGAQEVYVADNHTTRERLWSVRRSIPETFSATCAHQAAEDIVVPPAAIPRVVEAFGRLAKEHGMLIPCYGHAGDGNLHARLVKDPDEPLEKWRARLPEVLAELYRETASLGGTISGEHGIGSKRKKYLAAFQTEAELDLLRRIKRALDPNNILNPGKVVDI